MRGKIYLKNAAWLTVSGLILRVLGMGFRVYVAADLGSEGMGLYQLILSAYTVFVSLASSGINVASTRLAAKSLARGQGMGRTVAGLTTTAACFGTVAMLSQAALAGPAARWLLHDVRAELGLRILAPSLPFIAVAGALRGCFMARRRVQPGVLAQLIEQLVRMAVAVAALHAFAAWGAGYGCAAVLLGNTVSEVVSCLIIAGFARAEPAFRQNGSAAVKPYTGRELYGIVLPVEGSRILASVLQAAESSLIPLCLTGYLGTRSEAMSQYGALKGMAIPLLFFPFSVLAALSGLLMPEITRAHTSKDHARASRLIDSMMRATGLFSALAGVGFVLFGGELAGVLYGDEQVGLYVQVMGLVAPFMYLESMVDGVLKGLGEQLATFRYSLLDSALRIGGILLLLPRFGMVGFLAVMMGSNLLTCVLNTTRMLRTAHLRPNWAAWVGAPLALAVLGALAVYAVRCLGVAELSSVAALLAEGLALCVGYGLPLLALWRRGYLKAV